MTWKQTSASERVRDDGAVVMGTYLHSGARGRMLWTGVEPGKARYDEMKNKAGRRRTWRAPEAAMKAIDKEYPMKDAIP